jgi:hypothetical protein
VFVSTLLARASKLETVRIQCFFSHTTSLAAWVYVQALIPVAGERDVHGCLTAPFEPRCRACCVSGHSWPKGNTMVTLAVDTIEQWARPCFARPKLFEAQAALYRGELIAAGCLLREAVRRFLISQCEYHCCSPTKKSLKSPRQLANTLHRAGHCRGASFDWLCEIIDVGNKLAHCQPVSRSMIECCISLLHNMLDCSTGYSEFKRNGGAQ